MQSCDASTSHGARGWKATAQMLHACTPARVATESQPEVPSTRLLRSREPVASHDPHGEKASDTTAAVCSALNRRSTVHVPERNGARGVFLSVGRGGFVG